MPLNDFRWLYLDVLQERWSPAGGVDVQWAYLQLLLRRVVAQEDMSV